MPHPLVLVLLLPLGLSHLPRCLAVPLLSSLSYYSPPTLHPRLPNPHGSLVFYTLLIPLKLSAFSPTWFNNTTSTRSLLILQQQLYYRNNTYTLHLTHTHIFKMTRVTSMAKFTRLTASPSVVRPTSMASGASKASASLAHELSADGRSSDHEVCGFQPVFFLVL